ncbi:hypothetical protein [Acetivibrio ethanolgignens]|nr:hypothetical protein [Acetivibrio ethanolgignens]
MKVKAELEVIYDRIKKDIEPEEAKEILARIDAKKEELSLSVAWIKEYIEGYKELQYQILKKDLEDFEEISNYHIKVELDEKGIASIEPVVQGLVVDLIKKGNEADQNKVVTSKSLPEGTSQVSMLQEMRNSGVGNYFVRVRKDQKVFVLLKDFEVASNVQEVKKLESNFEHLRLEGKDFQVKENSKNIRIDFDKGTIEWDEVEHADFYDVYGEFSFPSITSYMGKYYLNPTNSSDHHDISNIENENTYSSLGMKDEYRSVRTWEQTGNRQLCTGNLTETKLALKELIICWSDYSDSLEKALADMGAIKIRIVPRSVDGLYISDLKSVYNGNELKGENIFITDFKVKAYLSKFLGLDFPLEP